MLFIPLSEDLGRTLIMMKVSITRCIVIICCVVLFSATRNPLVAQDESRVVFPWWDGDIYTMAIGDNQPKLIIAGVRAYETLWSPDGSKIVFEASANIYVVNSDGTNLTPLVVNKSILDGKPAWSPDGSRIAFTSNRDDDDLEIYVMNADGSEQMNLTSSPGRDAFPAWSPDGSRIVFASERDGEYYELYIMAADGTDVVRLTDLPGGSYKPAWSPDGNRIVFHRLDEDTSCARVYTINIDGSDVTQITGDVCELNRVVWSADGDKIYYQEYSNVYTVNPDGTDLELYPILPTYGEIVRFFDIYVPAPVEQPACLDAPECENALNNMENSTDPGK